MNVPRTPRCPLSAIAAAAILGAALPAAVVRAEAPAAAAPAATLPVTAADAVELRFEEFFRYPVGPRGLDFSEKLQGLDGQRVRITGHMVNHVHANPRVFILSPMPLKFHQCEYGLCDDLPAAALHVYVPGGSLRGERVAYTPGPLALTGRLSVGNREELDGRVSAVRLHLDAAPAPATTAAAAAVTP